MRTQIFIGLLLFRLVSLGQSALQQPIGAWRAYLSHTQVRALTEKDRTVFAISSGGLLSYELETGTLRTYATIEGLSGIDGTAIHYAAGADKVYIGYADGQIDYFSDPLQIGYYSDISRNSFYTDKRINDFASDPNRLYVATNFGLVVYNTDNNLPVTDIAQFAGNPSRLAVTSVTVYEGYIWIVIQNTGLYKAPVSAPNLKDPTVWTQVTLPGNVPVREVAANTQGIYVRSQPGIYEWVDSAWQVIPRLSDGFDKLVISPRSVGGLSNLRAAIINPEGVLYDFSLPSPILDAIVTDDRRFYLGTSFFGMYEFDNWNFTRLIPPGPGSNECNRIAVGNGEIYVAPKGYDQIYSPIPSAAGVYYYTAATQTWSVLDSVNNGIPDDVSTGFARAWYDNETDKAYMASWGRGLVILQDGVLEAGYTCEDGLPIISPPCDPDGLSNTRVSGVAPDPLGNIWVSLDFALPPLAVRKTDGQWTQIPNNKFPANNHIGDLITDDYGNAWMINIEKGLLVYTSAGTPDDLLDGRVLTLQSGINQGNLPVNDVRSLALDQDGFVWVGTTKGVTVFFDPFSISQGRIVDASVPVYEQQPLLKNSVVNAIAVDGGNRKWLATDNGVYLVSETGDEVILQFTADNSPLLADRVNDVEVDAATGEVYFATELGLISYQGDATAGATRCDDVLVFPNPVKPGFEGDIVIRGASRESAVKITTISGMLVREITAQGGTAVWDGRDLYGNPVRSGIYLALIAGRNGENGCIGKFSVIR
ncbi:MAG: two-component regulator propeller domain-containing protein [Bacteroidia bacterium]|nr:two-component regulator propeller domain-containing protein [Bacteroidia bacterium]